MNLTARRAQRTGLAAIVAVGAFTAVFTTSRLATGGPRRYDDDRSVAELSLPAPSMPSSAAPSATRAAATPDGDSRATTTPEEVVATFLEAERSGNFAGSFALLSGEEQAQSSATAWTAAHADLPEILDFELPRPARPADGRAEVTVRATLRPELDEVGGLVPGAADLRLAAIDENGDGEDGGWRIVFSESRLEPRYLDDATATEDTRAWVARRASCAPSSEDAEYDGGLLGAGAATLVAGLCGAEGSVEVGSPRRLPDSPDTDPYVAAFGPEVLEWARVVPVSGPAEIDVVVAPVGERWLVIGASTPAA